MSPASTRRVVCPECGLEFASRGLNGHRRLQHGVGVPPALPAAVPEALAREILGALDLLRGTAARIEEHVQESSRERREEPSAEAERLERELAELLQQIAAVERLAASGAAAEFVAAEGGDTAAELTRLRREQAKLVFRLDELHSGVPNDERFLV